MDENKSWWQRLFTRRGAKPSDEAPAAGAFLIKDDWKSQMEKHGTTYAHQWVREFVGQQFRMEGKRHGSLGVPKQISEMHRLAAGTAQDVLLTLRTWYRIRLAEIEGMLKTADLIKKEREAQFNEAVQWRTEVEHEFQDDTAKHSIFNAWLYLLFGLGLIVADIPFSWQLTAKGFGFDPHTSWTFPFFDRDGLLTAIVAFGIACSAVYIKFYHDFFVAPHIKKAVSILRTGLPRGVGELTWMRKRKVEVAWLAKFSTYSALLAFVIWGLFKTGEFRYDVLETDRLEAERKSNEREQRMRKDFLRTFHMAAPSEMAVTELSPEEKRIEKERMDQEQARRDRKRVIFILLTIMFPLMGGVLVSIAVRMLRSRVDRRQAHERYKKYEKFFGEKYKELAELAEKKSILTSVLTDHLNGAPEATQQLADAFERYYNAGYDEAIWSTINGQTKQPPVIVQSSVTNSNGHETRTTIVNSVA